jgi:hypothetical protein
MSSISATSTPAAQLAASASGAQRPEAIADRAAEAAAQQRVAADRKELSTRSLNDVDQTEGSADRDADGRRYDAPEDVPPAEPESLSEPAAPPDPPVRARDAFGERGNRLDLDA